MIRVVYRSGKEDKLDVYDYKVSGGWFIYQSNDDCCHKNIMIPSDTIKRVEAL